MRLLHIISSMDPVSGGPCQGIRNNNPLIRDLGVYREVVCMDDPASEFLGADDFPIHALGPAKGLWQYSNKLFPWLKTHMQSFDVVIINGLWLFFSYAGWRILKKIQRGAKNKGDKVPRVFVMPHGMLDPYFQLAPDRKIKAIRNFLYWHLIESKVINDSDGLLFTSELELLLARKSFTNYHPKGEHNVGYGVPPPPQYSSRMQAAFLAKCPIQAGRRYFLFFGRVHPKKGVDMLVASYLELLAKNDSKEFPALVIAGPGMESEYGVKIKKGLSSIPAAESNVFYTGMLIGDAKWGAFYGADAFVLPSHQENFGIAVVEALACGKPVIISDQVNIWKEISVGKGGIIGEDTKESVYDNLLKWISMSDHEKAEMGKLAFQVFLNNFQVKTAATNFYKIIAQERDQL
jgi:glycosyltransferase involved in cell wall biosynthesis